MSVFFCEVYEAFKKKIRQEKEDPLKCVEGKGLAQSLFGLVPLVDCNSHPRIIEITKIPS